MDDSDVVEEFLSRGETFKKEAVLYNNPSLKKGIVSTINKSFQKGDELLNILLYCTGDKRFVWSWMDGEASCNWGAEELDVQ